MYRSQVVEVDKFIEEYKEQTQIIRKSDLFLF